MKQAHAQIQALKGRHQRQVMITHFQDLKWFGFPITGRCPALMILPLQGIGYVNMFENHYRLFISCA